MVFSGPDCNKRLSKMLFERSRAEMIKAKNGDETREGDKDKLEVNATIIMATILTLFYNT